MPFGSLGEIYVQNIHTHVRTLQIKILLPCALTALLNFLFIYTLFNLLFVYRGGGGSVKNELA